MELDYVVVRKVNPSTRGFDTRGFDSGGFQAKGLGDEEPQMKLETVSMQPEEAEDFAEEDDVHSVAPSMPLRLIAPMSLDGAAAQPVISAGNVTWGVQAVGAHVSSRSGDGVTVAILDTGIFKDHPAFAGIQSRIVEANFTKAVPHDTHGHGTHCAGTVFGQDVSGQRIGVAPGIKRALIGKVLGKGGGQSKDIANAINWAIDEGANVISMSLGIDFPGFVKILVKKGMSTELATSMALQGYTDNLRLFEAIGALVANNGRETECILVAAAGNESQMDKDPSFKIGVAPPAAARGFVSVGALGQVEGKYGLAYFSNVGAQIAGPGVDITSADAHSSGLTAMSGTSMATPHVAGVAALWAEDLMKNGGLSAPLLVGKVVGSGSRNLLADGLTAKDVGSGMVQAPV